MYYSSLPLLCILLHFGCGSDFSRKRFLNSIIEDQCERDRVKYCSASTKRSEMKACFKKNFNSFQPGCQRILQLHDSCRRATRTLMEMHCEKDNLRLCSPELEDKMPNECLVFNPDRMTANYKGNSQYSGPQPNNLQYSGPQPSNLQYSGPQSSNLQRINQYFNQRPYNPAYNSNPLPYNSFQNALQKSYNSNPLPYNPLSKLPYNPLSKLPYNPLSKLSYNLPYNPVQNAYNSNPRPNLPYNPAQNFHNSNPLPNIPDNRVQNVRNSNSLPNMPKGNGTFIALDGNLFDYNYEKVIGSGKFGTVILANLRKDPNYVIALKKKRFSTGDFGDEVGALKAIGDFMGEDPQQELIGMKYHPGNTLESLLEKGLSEKEKAIILDLAFAQLKTLHEAGWIHRDLKPENIIVSSDLSAVSFVDFGLAEPLSKYESTGEATNMKQIDVSRLVKEMNGIKLHKFK